MLIALQVQVHKARKKLRRLLQGEHRRGGPCRPGIGRATPEALLLRRIASSIVASPGRSDVSPRPTCRSGTANELAKALHRFATPHLQRRKARRSERSCSTLGEDNYTLGSVSSSGRVQDALSGNQGCYRHRRVERDQARAVRRLVACGYRVLPTHAH